MALRQIQNRDLHAFDLGCMLAPGIAAQLSSHTRSHFFREFCGHAVLNRG